MDERHFTIGVLEQWVITRQDFETILANALATVQVQGADREDLAERVREDFERLQEADLNELGRLRGDRQKLSREIAAILRW